MEFHSFLFGSFSKCISLALRFPFLISYLRLKAANNIIFTWNMEFVAVINYRISLIHTIMRYF